MQKILLKPNFVFSFTQLFPLHNFIPKPNFIPYKLLKIFWNMINRQRFVECCIKWLLEKLCLHHVHSFLQSFAHLFFWLRTKSLNKFQFQELKLFLQKKIKILNRHSFLFNSEKAFWVKRKRSHFWRGKTILWST